MKAYLKEYLNATFVKILNLKYGHIQSQYFQDIEIQQIEAVTKLPDLELSRLATY